MMVWFLSKTLLWSKIWDKDPRVLTSPSAFLQDPMTWDKFVYLFKNASIFHGLDTPLELWLAKKKTIFDLEDWKERGLADGFRCLNWSFLFKPNNEQISQ